MAQINGFLAKEILCKNDDCRKLLGYERVKSGLLIFICPRCKQKSVFKINYGKGQENIDNIISEIEERR